MGNCTNCCEACAFCEYVDVPDKVLWRELKKTPPRIWKIRRLLARNGASPNATQRQAGGRRDTVLHAAVRMGALVLVDEIVTGGAKLELASEVTDTTPIQHAVTTNRKDIVRFLVEMNIDLGAHHHGETTLTWLVGPEQEPFWHMLPEILAAVAKNEKNERLCGTNRDMLNALQVCIRDRLQRPLDILHTFGFPVDAPTARGSPSLHFSIEINQLNAVERLLDEGASIAGRDALRRTPLLVAVIVRNAAAAEILLEYIRHLPPGTRKTRLNDTDKAGNSAVHYATVNSRGGLLGLLLDAGCEPDQKNKQELSPMHIAASEGNAPVAHKLIDYGADFEALDLQGKTPLHRALAHGHLAVVGVLLDVGARSVGVAADGSTPLMAANESHLLGHLGTDILRRIDAVEMAALANAAIVKHQKEVDRKNRKRKKAEEQRLRDVKEDAKRKQGKKVKKNKNGAELRDSAKKSNPASKYKLKGE